MDISVVSRKHPIQTCPSKKLEVYRHIRVQGVTLKLLGLLLFEEEDKAEATAFEFE